MIREYPVIDFLEAELWNVDSRRWESWIGNATRVDIRRGGKREGVVNTMEVGTMALTLRDALDPTTNPHIRPNVPIRVRAKAGFYGPVQMNRSVLGNTWQATGNAGGDDSTVYLDGATDSAYTDIVGFEPGRSYVAFVTAWSTGSAYMGFFPDVPDLYRYQEVTGPSREYALPPFTATQTGHRLTLRNIGTSRLRVSQVRIVDVSSSAAIFTGTILDIDVTYPLDKDTGERSTIVNVAAVDGVQSLANTNRFGAVSLGGYETWRERITRLAQSSRVPFSDSTGDDLVARYMLSFPRLDTSGWVRFGALPTGITGPSWKQVQRVSGGALQWSTNKANGTVTIPGKTLGAKRTITGLTPGTTYRLVGTASNGSATTGPDAYALGVIGIGWGATARLATRNTPTAMPAYEFQATSSTHDIAFVMSENATMTLGTTAELVQLWDVKLYELGVGNAYALRDVVYESTLVNHLDMACTSVGARWWVDVGNVVQCRAALGVELPIATFTDTRTPGHHEYVNVALSFDTRNVVNDLALTNHGRKPDPDTPGNFIADDIAYSIQEGGSIQTWGQRQSRLDTCLYTGGSYAYSIANRSREIFAESSAPELAATGFRWNAQEDTALAFRLDIYRRVDVRFRGMKERARIVGLTHTIRPSSWMVDVELTDILVGATLADFDAYYPTQTTADFDALWTGKTTAEFDAWSPALTALD